MAEFALLVAELNQKLTNQPAHVRLFKRSGLRIKPKQNEKNKETEMGGGIEGFRRTAACGGISE